MKINEAIILAGGLGTRLRSAVPELPKCMAPVAGRPFIHHVIEYLKGQGIQKFLFSLGYKHQDIESYLDAAFPDLQKRYVVEKEPLGTGGAIKLACLQATEKTVLITNGDTLFRVDLAKLAAFHFMSGSVCTLSLKPMADFERYGVVELKTDYRVWSFREKQYYEKGLINGGLYLLNVVPFLEETFPPKFSFEKDYLEQYYTTRRIFGVVDDAYFIDIGIPVDYQRAQTELAGGGLGNG